MANSKKEEKAEKINKRDKRLGGAITALNKGDLSREERIAMMCETINKGEHGGVNKDAVTYLGSRDVQKLERFSSGDPELDDALGGGWPVGRFIEIYGPESGGKSTMCLHAIAEYQKAFPEAEVALIDTEYSFDEEYAKALGVNTRWVIVHQPDNGTQALNVLEELIKLGTGLIVVDSVAALTTKEEMDGNLGDGQVAEQARLMSKALRRLTGEAGKRLTTVFWTNQLREKIGVTYGDTTTTPAGRALKHYASIRCSIRRVGTEMETVEGVKMAVANETKVDVKKNKTAPPFRSAKFYISYGRGIDPVVSKFDAGVKRGVIEKKGTWFAFNGENIAQGRYNAIVFLQENEELANEVIKAVNVAVSNKVPVIAVEDEEAPKVIKKPSSRKKKAEEVEVTDV